MKRVRLRVGILALWLVLFSGIESMLTSLKFSGITYLFVLATVIIVLAAPRMQHVSIGSMLIIPVPLFLGVKAWLGAFSGSNGILFILFEIACISLTTILAYWVSLVIGEFEAAIANITIGHHEKMPESASVGQGFMYREVRRARNHHRPLAVMSVAVDDRTVKVLLDRMTQEAQFALMKHIKLSAVSKTLCDGLEDCAIIVQSNDHFLVALPETTPDEVPVLVERLRKQVFNQIGVDLKIGAAFFPKDSYTFEGLVTKATSEMETDQEPQPSIELSNLPLEHHVTRT